MYKHNVLASLKVKLSYYFFYLHYYKEIHHCTGRWDIPLESSRFVVNTLKRSAVHTCCIPSPILFPLPPSFFTAKNGMSTYLWTGMIWPHLASVSLCKSCSRTSKQLWLTPEIQSAVLIHPSPWEPGEPSPWETHHIRNWELGIMLIRVLSGINPVVQL